MNTIKYKLTLLPENDLFSLVERDDSFPVGFYKTKLDRFSVGDEWQIGGVKRVQEGFRGASLLGNDGSVETEL